MKGRKVPPRLEVAAIVEKAEPLTMADFEAALFRSVMYCSCTSSAPFASERMPEPTPYERGVLDRYQERRRRR